MSNAHKLAAIAFTIPLVISVSGLLCVMRVVIKHRNELWMSSLKRPP